MTEDIDVFQQIRETYGIAPSEIQSVSVLSQNIKQILTTHPDFTSVLILGEIANFKKAGHIYFDLKDEESKIGCIYFKNMQKDEDFDYNGQVLVRGAVKTYEKRSQYQLNVVQILPVGEGISLLKHKRLERKLENEGLFDESRKRPIPPFPRKIGIITSKDGAAYKDILREVEMHFPKMDMILAPATVQGDDAPKNMIRSLRLLSETNEVDTIIIARGGGSAEDLMAFDDEALVREISACDKPIVTGIGHGKDVTFAERAADKGMSTPSTAAEAAVLEIEKLKDTLNSYKRHLERSYKTRLSSFEVNKKDIEIKKSKTEIAKYKALTILLIFMIILISILIMIR